MSPHSKYTKPHQQVRNHQNGTFTSFLNHQRHDRRGIGPLLCNLWLAVQLAYPSPCKGPHHQQANVNNVRVTRLCCRTSRLVSANNPTLHITRAIFPLRDKFVVGLGYVGLARLSDVPLHTSTNRLARRHCSPISFSLRTHIPRCSCRSMCFCVNAALLAALIIGHEC